MNETCCVRPQLASLLDDIALTGPDALYATKKAEVRSNMLIRYCKSFQMNLEGEDFECVQFSDAPSILCEAVSTTTPDVIMIVKRLDYRSPLQVF